MPLNIDWQQILLHLFNFVLLFAILYFLLYKPVKRFMDKRAEYYQSLDAQSNANLADAEQAKETYRQKLASVEDEIAARRAKAQAEIEEARAEALRHAGDEAAGIVADARRNMEDEHKRMLRQAQSEITGMIADAAEKIVAQSTTSEAFDQFLDAAKRGESDA